MRMISLAFCCLLVLSSCQKEIGAGLSNEEGALTLSLSDCNCRLIKMVHEAQFNQLSYLIDYNGNLVSARREDVIYILGAPATAGDDDGSSDNAIPAQPASDWIPVPVTFTYKKGILLSATSSNKALAFEYRFDGKLSKLRKFNTGPAGGVTLPYRYYKPEFDAQDNIIQLKEFDMAGHQVGKIDITYTNMPNTLAEMTPFNFEMDLGIEASCPLITYFVHKSKYLVSKIAINNDPAIELTYHLEDSPKEIMISKGDGEVRHYYYECQ